MRSRSGRNPASRYRGSFRKWLRTFARFLRAPSYWTGVVLAIGGTLSFDALQMRLHPAPSRIERLSRETPASLLLFDCLLNKAGQPLLALPSRNGGPPSKPSLQRQSRERLSLTPFTRDYGKRRHG